MQKALLREQVLGGFLHVPMSSIPVCLRMSRAISASHADVVLCVNKLVSDGLLVKILRKGRLPPLYTVTEAAAQMLNQEEYQIERKLSLYEQKTLEDACKMEHKFAQDQDTVIQFLQAQTFFCSTLLIQDLLRNSTNEDNIVYVNTILAQLAWNDEIEGLCQQMLWKFKRKATQHVWS